MGRLNPVVKTIAINAAKYLAFIGSFFLVDLVAFSSKAIASIKAMFLGCCFRFGLTKD